MILVVLLAVWSLFMFVISFCSFTLNKIEDRQKKATNSYTQDHVNKTFYFFYIFVIFVKVQQNVIILTLCYSLFPRDNPPAASRQKRQRHYQLQAIHCHHTYYTHTHTQKWFFEILIFYILVFTTKTKWAGPLLRIKMQQVLTIAYHEKKWFMLALSHYPTMGSISAERIITETSIAYPNGSMYFGQHEHGTLHGCGKFIIHWDHSCD